MHKQVAVVGAMYLLMVGSLGVSAQSASIADQPDSYCEPVVANVVKSSVLFAKAHYFGSAEELSTTGLQVHAAGRSAMELGCGDFYLGAHQCGFSKFIAAIDVVRRNGEIGKLDEKGKKAALVEGFVQSALVACRPLWVRYRLPTDIRQ